MQFQAGVAFFASCQAEQALNTKFSKTKLLCARWGRYSLKIDKKRIKFLVLVFSIAVYIPTIWIGWTYAFGYYAWSPEDYFPNLPQDFLAYQFLLSSLIGQSPNFLTFIGLERCLKPFKSSILILLNIINCFKQY